MWELNTIDNPILDESLLSLPGIGPSRAESLKQLGIRTIRDLISRVPRKYIHRKSAQTISELDDEGEAVVLAEIVKKSFLPKGRKGLLELIFKDRTGTAKALFFNVPRWMSDKFNKGETLLIWGKYKREKNIIVFLHPDFERGIEGNDKIIPVYPNEEMLVKEHIGMKILNKAILSSLDRVSDLPDPMPKKFLEKLCLPSLIEALIEIHNPKSAEKLEKAKSRFAFDELFIYQLFFAKRRLFAKLDKNATPLKPGKIFKGILSSLPFELTDGQSRALCEILERMMSPGRSLQLLNGDVGSGKTAIALLVALAAIDTGLQVAILVPSLIVARQHADWIADIVAGKKVEVGFLTGECRSEELLRRISSGEIDIVVGTKALLSPSVKFKKLGLVIIDEQQRFGVLQRAELPDRAGAHVLLMTATPIPRSTALAIYGDLEMTILEGFPTNRAGTKTYLRQETEREKVFDFISSRIEMGERAIVVHPLIIGDDHASARFGFKELEKRFGDKVALLHGEMQAEEKDRIFSYFRTGKVKILATTNIIEIGIDVPSATVVVIESAERFGLSQLHQIRGRVGRSDKKGYCIMLTSAKTDSKAYKRLEYFSKTEDGFAISMMDIEERGEGEILGLSQSGRPDFEFASPLKMNKILKIANNIALTIIDLDPELIEPENYLLKIALNNFRKSALILDSSI